MLLRRVIEHVKAQNWTAVALDFVIVVVGVFIGIQVSNWNDALGDRRAEAETLRALHEEIEQAVGVTERIVGWRLAYAQGLSSAVDVIFERVDNRPLTEDECSALTSSHILYVGRSDLPALNSLQSAGRLNIIRDASLRGALSGLIQSREALEYAMGINEFTYDLGHVYPEAFEKRPENIALEDVAKLELTVVAQCDVETIRSNQALMNDIANNADAVDAFMRDGLQPWLQQFRKAHSRLDAYLSIQHGEEAG